MASGKEAKKEEAPAGEAAPKKSKKMLIIIVGAVVLVAVIAVAAVMLLGKKKGDAAEGKEDAEESTSAAHPKFDPHKPPVFVALEPFTVNLASEDGNEQFLQVVASLRVGDEKIGEEVKAFMPQIRHEVLSLLAGKKPSEITSPDGREQLASDIKDICNEVMGWEPPATKKKKKGAAAEEATGPVISVYFTQFIVQ
jgi:flagellar FliL protein